MPLPEGGGFRLYNARITLEGKVVWEFVRVAPDGNPGLFIIRDDFYQALQGAIQLIPMQIRPNELEVMAECNVAAFNDAFEEILEHIRTIWPEAIVEDGSFSDAI